jgi:hypothetical protein
VEVTRIWIGGLTFLLLSVVRCARISVGILIVGIGVRGCEIITSVDLWMVVVVREWSEVACWESRERCVVLIDFALAKFGANLIDMN